MPGVLGALPELLPFLATHSTGHRFIPVPALALQAPREGEGELGGLCEWHLNCLCLSNPRNGKNKEVINRFHPGIEVSNEKNDGFGIFLW